MDDRDGPLTGAGFSSFHDAVGYIFSSYVRAKPFRRVGFDKDTRNPAHTRRLLDAIGAPDRGQYNVRVTGSKGKGSTARLLAGVLESQGLRVGLFTSPHLIDYTERIRVNGRAIGEREFVRLLLSFRPTADRLASEFGPGDYYGPVGLTAVVAALHFRNLQTDVNVFELGRGARFDDVNVLDAKWAVITPVQHEHVEQLGPGLSDIAWNKAGAIGPGIRGATVGLQPPEALSVLKEEADRWGVALDVLGTDFIVENVRAQANETAFSVVGRFARYEDLTVSLLGRHQADNATVAVAAAERVIGGALSGDRLRKSLAGLRFPGRMHVLERCPRILIDGAINRESGAYAAEMIATLRPEKLVLVMGLPDDKDVAGLAASLGGEAATVIVTPAENPHLRYADAAAVRAALRRTSSIVIDCRSFEEAIALAEELAGRSGMVAVIGTQSLVADALRHYGVPTRDLE